MKINGISGSKDRMLVRFLACGPVRDGFIMFKGYQTGPNWFEKEDNQIYSY